MSLVALIGDCTTTTAVALAAAWPIDRDVVILEADRAGGSLAGWLDTPTTPSLTTLVASRRPRTDDRADGLGGAGILRWDDVAGIVHSSASGVRFIPAPVRSREAALALAEAERGVIPLLGGLDSPDVIADVGRLTCSDPLPAIVPAAATIVVLHRQDPSSAGAEAVRFDRLVELVEQLSPLQGRVVLGVIGDEPFDQAEIAEQVASHASTTIAAAYPIAADPLSAAVLAGRSGVSAKRLARLPLARSIDELVGELAPLGTRR